ncbi:MAG: helix-turn-helix domain-containing protein [Burkholderiaceae bacterium]|nr:helix-turn-helix domain-containing protein [Burkholderiaceae bacterium]
MAEIAADAGMARSYLYELTSGKKRDPSVRTLLRLSTALLISPLVLFRFFAEMEGVTSFAANMPTNRAVGLNDANDIAVFNADVSTPDHAVLAPGEVFKKIWEFQNVGSVPWRERKLVRVDGEYVLAKRAPNGALNAILDTYLTSLHQKVDIPVTLPGQPVRIAVEFAAPQESCTVASIWRIVDHHGQPCYGTSFICHVVITVMAQ